MPIGKTEISFELPVSEVSVIDGYCSAKGIKRTAVMRMLLKEWSNKKHLEAIMICRVAGSKPDDSGSDRDGQDSQLSDL